MNDTTAKADPVRALVAKWRDESLNPEVYGGKGCAARRVLALELEAALAKQVGADLDRYDAGLLSDFGGGNVEWWQDYIRAELDRAHAHYTSQAAPLPATPEVDLEQFRKAVQTMKLVGLRGMAQAAMEAEADRLLALIDAQHNREGV